MLSSAILHTLLFTNLVFIGLVTGGAMVIAVAYNRLFADLSLPDTLTVHRGLGRYIDPYQPILAIIGLIAGLAELWFCHAPWQTVPLLIGIGGIILLMVISRAISVPLSHKIVAWTPQAASEAHLMRMKIHWIRYHYLRSAFAVIGFCFFIITALLLV